MRLIKTLSLRKVRRCSSCTLLFVLYVLVACLTGASETSPTIYQDDKRKFAHYDILCKEGRAGRLHVTCKNLQASARLQHHPRQRRIVRYTQVFRITQRLHHNGLTLTCVATAQVFSTLEKENKMPPDARYGPSSDSVTEPDSTEIENVRLAIAICVKLLSLLSPS